MNTVASASRNYKFQIPIQNPTLSHILWRAILLLNSSSNLFKSFPKRFVFEPLINSKPTKTLWRVSYNAFVIKQFDLASTSLHTRKPEILKKFSDGAMVNKNCRLPIGQYKKLSAEFCCVDIIVHTTSESATSSGLTAVAKIALKKAVAFLPELVPWNAANYFKEKVLLVEVSRCNSTTKKYGKLYNYICLQPAKNRGTKIVHERQFVTRRQVAANLFYTCCISYPKLWYFCVHTLELLQNILVVQNCKLHKV